VNISRRKKVERMILAARQAGGRVAEREAVLARIGKTACICQRHAAMKAVNSKAKNNFEAWGYESIGAEVLSVPSPYLGRGRGRGLYAPVFGTRFALCHRRFANNRPVKIFALGLSNCSISARHPGTLKEGPAGL
jgi:hypothetical protein